MNHVCHTATQTLSERHVMLTKETHHYREQTQEAVGMSPQEQRNRRHILG